MATELGTAYVQIIPSAEGISGSIANVIEPEASSAGEKAGINIAQGISGALKGATTIVATGVAAVSGAIMKGTSDIAQYGDVIDKESQKLGISAEAYQEWDAILQHSGGSINNLKPALKTLTKEIMNDSDAFKELGISQQEMKNASIEDVLSMTISKLQEMDNGVEKTRLATQLLGKSSVELGALLNTSAEDTQAMRDRVHELGGVMTNEAIKASATFQDNMQDLSTAMSGLGRSMMVELMPGMNDILAGFTSLVIGEEGATEKMSAGFSSLFQNFSKIANEMIGKIGELAPVIVESIATILPQLIESSTQLIIQLANAIAQNLPTILPTLIPAIIEAAVQIMFAFGQAVLGIDWIGLGVQIIEALRNSIASSGIDILGTDSSTVENFLKGITSHIQEVMKKGGEVISSLLNGILSALPGVITSASTIMSTFLKFVMQNLPSVMQMGMNILSKLATGIIQALPDIVTALSQMFDTFVKTITENLPLIIEQGLALLSSLVKGILDNLPLLIESILSLLFAIISTIGQNLPTILQQGILLVGQIVTGIVQQIPAVIATIWNLMTQIVTKFTSYDWGSIGRNLIQGIANGISSAAGWIVDAAKNAAQAAFNAAKNLLGINSPSTKGEWLGDMYDEGVALGIERNVTKVEKATGTLVNDSFGELTAPAPIYNFDNQQRNTGDLTLNITINAADGMDVNELAELVAQRINFSVKQRELAYA